MFNSNDSVCLLLSNAVGIDAQECSFSLLCVCLRSSVLQSSLKWMENDVKGNQISQRNRSRASYNISRDMSKRSLSWISCVCVTLSKPDATHSFVIHKIPFRFHSNGETCHHVFMLNHFFPSHLSTAKKNVFEERTYQKNARRKLTAFGFFSASKFHEFFDVSCIFRSQSSI